MPMHNVNHFYFSLMAIKMEAVDKVQLEKLFQFLPSQPRTTPQLCLKTCVHSIYHILCIPLPMQKILPPSLLKTKSG